MYWLDTQSCEPLIDGGDVHTALLEMLLKQLYMLTLRCDVGGDRNPVLAGYCCRRRHGVCLVHLDSTILWRGFGREVDEGPVFWGIPEVERCQRSLAMRTKVWLWELTTNEADSYKEVMCYIIKTSIEENDE